MTSERESCYLYLDLDMYLPPKEDENVEEERVIVIDIMGDSTDSE